MLQKIQILLQIMHVNVGRAMWTASIHISDFKSKLTG